MGANPVQAWIFFRPYFHCFLNKKCSLLPRSLSYSFLYPKFTYMTFTHLQSFTSHFTGLFGTNIMTSCQLANVSSVGRALHWYHRVHRFKSCTGLVFTTAQIVLITAKISFIFIWSTTFMYTIPLVLVWLLNLFVLSQLLHACFLYFLHHFEYFL